VGAFDLVYQQGIFPLRHNFHVEKRMVLLPGDSAYTDATTPKKPANDANEIANKLIQPDFGATDGTDLTQVNILEVIRKFSGRLEEGDIALIYYVDRRGQALGGTKQGNGVVKNLNT